MKKELRLRLLAFTCILFFLIGVSGLAINSARADESSDEATIGLSDVTVSMVDGARIRLKDVSGGDVDKDGLGIRYALKMSNEHYLYLTDGSGCSDIVFGVLIAPKEYNDKNPIVKNNSVNEVYVRENLDNVPEDKYPLVDINDTVMGLESENSTERIFYASILKIKSDNLLREYTAVGYVCYKDGEDTVYKFADPVNAGCPTYIAQRAIEGLSAQGSEESTIQNLKDAYLTESVTSQTVNYTVKYMLKADFEDAYSELKSETKSGNIGATATYDELNDYEFVSAEEKAIFANGSTVI